MSKINYHSLMRRHIRKVLLICSSYDAYILEEDGRIELQIKREYLELAQSDPPSFKRVSSTDEAFELLQQGKDFDLILNMFNTGEKEVFSFAKRVKQEIRNIPVVLLANYTREIYRVEYEDRSAIDYIFSWRGSADLLMAIINLIEDRMNADDDILGVGVQAILLVEDSIRYYSTYLPAIYKIVLQQSNEFLKEAFNEQQQMLQKRARPKILLATCYDEAVSIYERYKQNLLGVISDVGFVIHKTDRSGEEKLDAGIELCRMIKHDDPNMPFLLQSSQENVRAVAKELGVGFIAKYSKTLLQQVSDYIATEFAFGDFIFRDPGNGLEVGRAKDLKEMQEQLQKVPDAVLLNHAAQDDLSKWMYARGLFLLAGVVKSILFDSIPPAELRDRIIREINDFRMLMGQGVVANFESENYSDYIWFARIGEGSLGGKARGLAFMNSMLQRYNFYDKYPTVRVLIPRTVVIATDYFDQFIRDNGLRYVINSDISDEEILAEFVASRLPEKLFRELRSYMRYAKGPLAIRSSSKLEDSHYQPFAGIYSTYMVPLTDNTDQMLRLVGKAIKSVYASVYFAASRAYFAATSNVLSEEKMAVVIQEVCGTEDQGYFFPTVSGVARSLNFNPIGDEKPEDGVCNVALGLGKVVVEGGQTLRFSPRYPQHTLQLSTPEITLRDTQRIMYALDLCVERFKTSLDDAINLHPFNINEAKHFRNMKHVASAWDIQNQMISDSSYVEGHKVITFNRILKYDTFPLAEIVRDILEMAVHEMRFPVEVEFAANLDVAPDAPRIFHLLQVRPIVGGGNTTLDWDTVATDNALIYTESALGIGPIEGVRDVVYIKESVFERKNTGQIAREVEEINRAFHTAGEGYVLVGPGRWGSSDPWLGIPVRWNDISEAKLIVEYGLEQLHVEPSQGTHFFQNLTSLGVGFLTLNPFRGDGRYDIAMLDAMQAVSETEFVRHVRFPEPLFIFVDGRNGKGIVSEHPSGTE